MKLEDLVVGLTWKTETLYYNQPKISKFEIIGSYYTEIGEFSQHFETTGKNIIKPENLVLQVYVIEDEYFGSARYGKTREPNIFHRGFTIKPKDLFELFNKDLRLLPEYRVYKFDQNDVG